MSLKEQFADQLKSQTDIWQAQIKDYQEQLQQAGAKAQSDYKKTVAQMEEKAEEARKLFQQVLCRTVGGSATPAARRARLAAGRGAERATKCLP